jgi:hypothetical protein
MNESKMLPRRSFLGLLAGLPLVGALLPTKRESETVRSEVSQNLNPEP